MNEMGVPLNTIILYSTGCPQCKVLASQLDKHKVAYEVCSDIPTMQRLGIRNVPVLSVDGQQMGMKDALSWLKGSV